MVYIVVCVCVCVRACVCVVVCVCVCARARLLSKKARLGTLFHISGLLCWWLRNGRNWDITVLKNK